MPFFRRVISIVPAKRDRKTSNSEVSDETQREQWRLDRRRQMDLIITGKLKPPQKRNLSRLKQLLKQEGFKIRGNRLLIERTEATFEVDLKMGHVSILRESEEPQILCVTLESTPWIENEDLTDFDVFLLSIVYLLANEPLPESITTQLNPT
jgi:hypothetical protein